ncbi:MAG: hypothetical protein K5872_22285 [Rhizobiaceae bacterium]|nr:hypothetical protein [Rhizobiaceae bacterium]MCV0408950.1 hypothetical protein [Rhizobiaceae bacterium]
MAVLQNTVQRLVARMGEIYGRVNTDAALAASMATAIGSVDEKTSLDSDDLFMLVDSDDNEAKKAKLSSLVASVYSAASYTPVISNTTNVAASANIAARRLRFGTSVLVFGTIDLEETDQGAATAFNLSIPVASNFGAVTDLHGFIASAFDNGFIEADTANDNARVAFGGMSRVLARGGTVSGAQTRRFFFEYQVI